MFKRYLVLFLGLALAAPALAGGYGYGGRHYYGGHIGYHHHGGGDAGPALLAGLVFGGLVGYMINEDRHYRNDVYWDDPDRVYGYGYREYRPVYRDYGYRYGDYHRYVRVVPQPARVVEVDSEFAGENCRMTREYTTTMEIDGKKHGAYGTKCLTANGSWILGRPKLVPDFN
ncbi:MAG: hypothetical protein WAL83_02730 [Arenicellales bacterium]|jgi:hypothetical protein